MMCFVPLSNKLESLFVKLNSLAKLMISHDKSALLGGFKCSDCRKAFKFKHHLKVKNKVFNKIMMCFVPLSNKLESLFVKLNSLAKLMISTPSQPCSDDSNAQTGERLSSSSIISK
jgi:hypothetical protein